MSDYYERLDADVKVGVIYQCAANGIQGTADQLCGTAHVDVYSRYIHNQWTAQVVKGECFLILGVERTNFTLSVMKMWSFQHCRVVYMDYRYIDYLSELKE